jgi:hypothetical protein
MTSTLDDSSKLWFERLYTRVGLPFWAGVLVVGFLPPLILTLLGYYTYGVKTDFTGGVSLGIPLLLANVIYILFSSSYIRRRVEALEKYAVSIGADKSQIQTSYLSDFRPVVATWAFLLVTGVLGAGTLLQPRIFLVSRLVERIALRIHALAPGDLSLGLPLINDCNLQNGTTSLAAEGLH